MSNLSPDFVLPENFCANPQEAWTIPARFYTDQNAFEHEKENVFAKSWICVAHSSELANANDYVTREIIGESIVLVRGRDKVLRAFYNVCPHRGHQLLSGEGKAKNVITCPYHAWAFKLDGNLAHARNCENVANFDSDKAQLVPVRLEEYAGFVLHQHGPQRHQRRRSITRPGRESAGSLPGSPRSETGGPLYHPHACQLEEHCR